jgi:type I restriction enzyme S subunit
MAGEWVKRKIGSLGRVVTGKTPPTADSSNFGGPYPFITIPDLDGRVLIDRTERTLSERGAEILRSCLLPAGSVMMSCIATVGRCGITTGPSFTNQQINSVIPNDEVDSRFLYYVFTQLGHELESAGAGGSVYTNVSKNRFSGIEVVLPADLNEQRAIAHILGTLDDKIELNRRMGETLEAMARALFKSWFVDFEPVRAKCRGGVTPPLHWPQHILDLFPARLVDSELGEIPEGWEVGTLGDLSEKPQYGYTASAKEEPVGPKFLRITDINKLPWIDWTTVPYCEIEPEDFEQYRLHSGDILIARMADPGHGVVIEEQVEAVFASYLIRFRLKDQAYIRYIQYWLRSDGYWELVTSRHAGTTRASLNAQVLSSFQLIIPPKPIASAFSEIVNALRNKVVAAVIESRTLAALRDALLPKLISGEIRVKDAERFLKERGL